MANSGKATHHPVLPARRAPHDALRLDDDAALRVLAAVAAAETASDVGLAALEVLLGLPGVRAGVLARAPRLGGDPVLVASLGYDCAVMATGAVLPLDAGMPLTEVVRTGAPQVVGTGPSWVGVPTGPGSAFLLSLTAPPPDDAGLARLVRLGRALEGALARADRACAARTDLAVLEAGLSAPAAGSAALVVRSRPFRPPLSGDVAEQVSDGDARWVLVADVCGRGARAAVAADRLRAAFAACAPGSEGPAEVLARLDRVLPPGEEDFATALVVRVAGGRVALASAGHPAPLQVPGGLLPVVPGEPIGLRLGTGWPGAAASEVALAPGSLLLLTTDGLVDRGHEVDLDAVVRGLPEGLTADGVADAVLAACTASGAAQDDATLAVLQV